MDPQVNDIPVLDPSAQLVSLSGALKSGNNRSRYNANKSVINEKDRIRKQTAKNKKKTVRATKSQPNTPLPHDIIPQIIDDRTEEEEEEEYVEEENIANDPDYVETIDTSFPFVVDNRYIPAVLTQPPSSPILLQQAGTPITSRSLGTLSEMNPKISSFTLFSKAFQQERQIYVPPKQVYIPMLSPSILMIIPGGVLADTVETTIHASQIPGIRIVITPVTQEW